MSGENYSSLLASIDWQRALPTGVSLGLGHYLSDRGSLTQRLKSCTKKFSVCQLDAYHNQPYVHEAALMGDLAHYRIREVYLQGNGVDWVFARSLWPDIEPCSALNELANQPLGELLFAQAQNGDIARHYGCVSVAEQTLWARLSIYSYRSIPVLVQELFLPESPAYLEAC